MLKIHCNVILRYLFLNFIENNKIINGLCFVHHHCWSTATLSAEQLALIEQDCLHVDVSGW